MTRPLAYLAVPYSHPEASVREERFKAANKMAGQLLNAGWVVFSPISHTHPIALECSLPLGWEFWENFDKSFLSCSKYLFVLRLDGWEQSKGVQGEIKIAQNMGVEIIYLDPETVIIPENR